MTATPPARRRIATAATALVAVAAAAFVAIQSTPRASAQPTSQPAGEQRTVTPSGLTIIERGFGDPAKPGDRVSVHYTGTLQDGRVFDSSRTRGQPFTFTLGAHQVIAGWDEGVAGMRVGQRRTLIIPPNLGYGERGMPPAIPANATLTFEVEVTGIEPGNAH